MFPTPTERPFCRIAILSILIAQFPPSRHSNPSKEPKAAAEEENQAGSSPGSIGLNEIYRFIRTKTQ